MKICRLVLITLLFSGQLFGASGTSAGMPALHSDDYAARLAALNALESRIAHASAPTADAAQRAALERELLGCIAAPEIPELSRAYVMRLLPPIASEATVKQMLQLVLDPKTSRMLGNDAAGLLAVLGDLVPPDTLVKSMLTASDPARELLWSAVALRADPRLAKPLVKQLQKMKLPLDDLGIQALGAMGGRDAAAYLFAQWKQADGTRRTVLARAIVHTGAAKTSELEALCLNSEGTDIRSAALRQWAIKKEAAALEFLQSQLETGARDINALIAVQLTVGSSASWNWIKQRGPTLSEATLITVLQSIREQQRKEMEPWVLERLERASEPVALAAMRCLAVVGGSPSTEALIARTQSPSKKISAEAMSALAVLKDSSLDARLQGVLADPRNPNYIRSLDLTSQRNSPGSVDFFNKLFAARSPEGEVLAAGLRGMDRLGNIDSVKLLLARLATEPDAAVVRALQISIKRVVIRLEQPDRIWPEAFLPALSPPATVEQQARILPILDAVPSPAALAFCIERVRGNDAVLARAAEQALIRWRSIEVCDYWLSVLSDPTQTDADRDQAVGIIEMTLRSGSQSEKPNLIAEKAAALFLASENKDLRTKLISVVSGLPNRWRAEFHKTVSAGARSLPDYRELLENLIKKDSADAS